MPSLSRPLCVLVCLIATGLASGSLRAQDSKDPKAADRKASDAKPGSEAKPGPLPGHSVHGEAFDEGPRQKAYLMGNTGKVHFPITAKDPLAQQFFNQGIGQVHGFWYLEAERSFRQVLAIDPDCAMAYWGIAMANTNNETRAKKFLAEAVKRKQKASPREQQWIDMLNNYYQGEKDDKARKKAQVRALETLSHEDPKDLEARAFLAYYLWKHGSTTGIPSHQAIDSILELVFLAEPMHPAHHYRIHLWDEEKAARALGAAALNGQASPGIAHQWHMSGHIFSKVQRYDDAAWQQEASARVDHAHMMRDRVMPYEIHNYAHNNEWCIRDLNYVGRAHDALALAKNLIELPRHPKHNVASNRGSGAGYGRLRIFDVLTLNEMWDEYLALADTVYLEVDDDHEDKVKRLRWLGVAQFAKGKTEEGKKTRAALETILADMKGQQDKAGNEAADKARKEGNAKPAEKKPEEVKKPQEPKKPEEAKSAEEKKPEEAKQGDEKATQDAAEKAKQDAAKKAADEKQAAEDKKLEEKVTKARDNVRKEFDQKIKIVERALQHIKGQELTAAGDFKAALVEIDKAGDLKREHQSQAQFRAGDPNKAEQTAKGAFDSGKNQVYPLANYVEILHKVGKHKEAKEAFEKLRTLGWSADLKTPLMARLEPIALEYGLPADWRIAKSTPADAGIRPSLDALGPFRWAPSPAADWNLNTADGRATSLKDYKGKPVVVIFYLGFGCLHCVEQLNAFAPLAKEYADAGISLVAISTDAMPDLKKSLDACKLEGGFPFPLVSDSEHKVFQSYRSYDDFEKAPLHGTFLIDGDGLVRWQDIGAEPFRDAKFLLGESKRLLAQPK